MRLTFHGSVLILGGSSELGRALALALRAEGAQVCCVCRDDTGCARCAQDGLPALVLADPETLPARCEALLGLPVGHLADLLHSRFEQLVAMAPPEAIERWADDDIALRARCLRAVSPPFRPLCLRLVQCRPAAVARAGLVRRGQAGR